MFILLKISGMALAAIAGGVLIAILVAAGAIKKMFPEKKRVGFWQINKNAAKI